MFWDLSRYWKPYWFHTLPIRSHNKITQKILNFQFFPMRSRNLKVPKIREFEMYMGQNIENRILILRYDSQIKIPWFGTYTAKKFGRNCMARLSQVIKPFDSHIWELLFLPTTIVYYIFIYYKFLFIIECYFIFILHLLYIIL